MKPPPCPLLGWQKGEKMKGGGRSLTPEEVEKEIVEPFLSKFMGDDVCQECGFGQDEMNAELTRLVNLAMNKKEAV